METDSPSSLNNAVLVLGGEGQPAHLAPANGFPPQVYLPLLRPLWTQIRVYATIPLPMRTQTPPPRCLDWKALADEMAGHLQRAGLAGLVGLGHSMGGTLSVFAAARQPGLFRALVLLDPVIFPYRILAPLALLRALGLKDRFPLAVQARRRRDRFASPEEAGARYRRHPFFRHWHPEALAAYLTHGLRPTAAGGWQLAYPPAWEAAIFASTPLDVWRWVPRVRVPTLVVYGERSNTFRPAALRRLQRHWPHARFVALPGAGHMFPMERPEETAQVIAAWLAETVT